MQVEKVTYLQEIFKAETLILVGNLARTCYAYSAFEVFSPRLLRQYFLTKCSLYELQSHISPFASFPENLWFSVNWAKNV